MKVHWDMPEWTLSVLLRMMVNLTDFNVMVQKGVSNHFTAHSLWLSTCQRQGRLDCSPILLLPEVPLSEVPKNQSRSGLTESTACPPDLTLITLTLPDMIHRLKIRGTVAVLWCDSCTPQAKVSATNSCSRGEFFFPCYIIES